MHPSSRGERWNNNGADWRQAARPLQYATRQQHSTLSSIPCQQLPLHSWNARREPIYLSRKQRASSSQLPISLLFPCCSSPRRVLSPPSTYGHLLILAHRAEIRGINDSIFCGRILVQRSDTSKAKRNSFEGGRTHVRSSCAPSGINQTKRAARGRADNMWRGVVQQQTKQKKSEGYKTIGILGIAGETTRPIFYSANKAKALLLLREGGGLGPICISRVAAAGQSLKNLVGFILLWNPCPSGVDQLRKREEAISVLLVKDTERERERVPSRILRLQWRDGAPGLA